MSSELPISEGTIASNIKTLRSRIEALESDLDRAKEELHWWQTGLRLFADPASESAATEVSTQPRLSENENGSKPTLRQAILTVFEEQPKTWQTEAVIKELRERDWLPGGKHGEHHVRSKLSEMHRKGQARRVGRGRYRLPLVPRTDE